MPIVKIHYYYSLFRQWNQKLTTAWLDLCGNKTGYCDLAKTKESRLKSMMCSWADQDLKKQNNDFASKGGTDRKNTESHCSSKLYQKLSPEMLYPMKTSVSFPGVNYTKGKKQNHQMQNIQYHSHKKWQKARERETKATHEIY